MRLEDSTRTVVRHPEQRHAIDVTADAIFDEGTPIPARLINLSRHGFRLALAGSFAAGERFRIEVSGWPRLAAQVVWNDNGRIGCLFVDPPAPRVFETMCRTTSGLDRDAF